ncbi:MAG: hypothetical protein ABJF10_20075 [Chthoniobacter sp.]|uniref:hypothetical protein n=1 Tax=Chthoniobacter sp. TaxID=2510640 RepID=UPI0032A745CD
MKFFRPLLSLSLALLPLSLSLAEDAPKTDPRYPFRTDFANANLPWYQPKPLEFPPHHSDRRIGGTLISADYVHRSGQFRTSKTGEIVDFTMPPYASVHYLLSEADLRDVPLGTDYLFFLNDDGHGHFTRLATMEEQFTMDASHSFTYRLDEVKLAEGKLLTTKQSIPKNLPEVGKAELHVNAATRVWKDDQQIKLEDLQPGDVLLYNLTGRTAASPGTCTDIWVGVETHKKTIEQQMAKHAAFVKLRGLPGWIDKTEGNKLTITFFSDDVPAFKKTWTDDLVVGKDVAVTVANDELRPWNPPVDKEKSSILEVQKVPTECYGCSGVRVVVQVAYMLEGFRRGHCIRLFGAGWPVKDPPYGENLMNYGYRGDTNTEIMENTAKEYPLQFPYRTDYSNENLPWFKFRAGEKPPSYSEHRVLGELVKVDAEKRTGQFRTDRTGETVEFTLLPGGNVQYLNANSALADIPLGTRCTFSLYQDNAGAFTQAWAVTDDFSHLASNSTKYRVTALNLAEGRIDVGWQLAKMKNYNGDMEQTPDLGQHILLVTPETRVWKGDLQVKLADLAVGDLILADVSGEQAGQPSHCTDIWIGEDTHKAVTERQSKKLTSAKK